MSIKRKEFDTLVSKFGFETKSTHHLIATLRIDGKVVVKTRRSNQRGELPSSDKIRQQLRLNDTQFRDAISCTLGKSEYIEILDAKGVLGQPRTRASTAAKKSTRKSTKRTSRRGRRRTK